MLPKIAILFFVCAAVGCGQDRMINEPNPMLEVGEAGYQTKSELDPQILAKWQTSCALCHLDGNGGAPRVQIQADWNVRSHKNKAEFLKNTIEGLNNMPPLGYCMACEEADFIAMIDFMVGDLR